MNTKYIIAAVVGLSSLSSVNAQTLIAGWDFSEQEVQDAVYVGGVPVGTIGANFTDTTPNGTGAAARGMLYFDGTQGSSLWDGEISSGQVAAFVGTASINTTINTTRRTTLAPANAPVFGVNFDSNLGGLALGFNPVVGSRDTLVIGLNTTGYETVIMSFAQAIDSGTSATISWSYKIGAGGSLVSTGVSTTFNSTTFSTSTVNLSAITAVNNVNNLFLVGTFTADTLGAGLAGFDNIQVTGVAAIPEPSSYAALAGVAALGLVAARRRRSAK